MIREVLGLDPIRMILQSTKEHCVQIATVTEIHHSEWTGKPFLTHEATRNLLGNW